MIFFLHLELSNPMFIIKNVIFIWVPFDVIKSNLKAYLRIYTGWRLFAFIIMLWYVTLYTNCNFPLQVSWVRHRDIHLLTVGRYTYTGDQRFRSINQPPSEDWTLQIKYPQIRDSGIYECQISTTPHISQYIHLQVVGECDLITTNVSSFILYMHLLISFLSCISVSL